MSYLHDKWTAFLPSDCDMNVSDSIWNRLVDAYSQPNRFYHNLLHVEQIVSVLEQSGCRDKEVYLAAFFHDYVYVAGYDENESQSGAYAERSLVTMGFDPGLSVRVKTLILHTASYGMRYKQHAGKALFDADMSILGQDEEAYDDYSASVRKEYAMLKDREYNAARHAFLKGLQTLPSIFKLDWFKDRFEEQAQLNIANEIKFLEIQ